MGRDLRLLAAFAFATLLVSTVFFPTGCSGGGSPIVGPSGDDASMIGDGATAEAAPGSDGPVGPGACQSNADCATSTKGHVCVSGTCQVCGTNADCPTGQKCDAHASCVACLTSADCSADQRCVNNACAMGCDPTSTCPTGTVCDTTSSACVACLSDANCSAPTGKCNTTTNTCVACLTSTDCAAGTVCNTNSCVPGCSPTQPCPTGEQCVAQSCVECTVNSQCHGATPWCDTTNDTCVQCLPSNDNCPTGQYCAASACAPGCKSNLDCVALADAGAGDAAGDAPSDAAMEGGGGTSGGTICDTMNHVCVECVIDANCPLGQTCSNNMCVTGCDATHGCPAGSGCCSGLCQPLNTVDNCTGCGVACDTTSGNSQGAACGLGGCTYTGCAAGWGDCSSGAPDSDGCETNLTTTNEKVCADGTCVSNTDCCTGLDCTTPPGPAACFPAHGTCPSEGAACSYTQNSGSVICSGTTCCNAINGTCSNSCTLACNTGFGHCTADPSKGCESNLTTCINTPCCTAGMCNVHSNGQGQQYTDCVDAAGTPGSGSTYNATMANDAAKAWAAAGTIGSKLCGSPADSCISSVTGSGGSGHCVVWCYTGALAGYQVESAANQCTCPTASSTPTWQ